MHTYPFLSRCNVTLGVDADYIPVGNALTKTTSLVKSLENPAGSNSLKLMMRLLRKDGRRIPLQRDLSSRMQ